jgi:hypothetical protein
VRGKASLASTHRPVESPPPPSVRPLAAEINQSAGRNRPQNFSNHPPPVSPHLGIITPGSPSSFQLHPPRWKPGATTRPFSPLRPQSAVPHNQTPLAFQDFPASQPRLVPRTSKRLYSSGGEAADASVNRCNGYTHRDGKSTILSAAHACFPNI